MHVPIALQPRASTRQTSPEHTFGNDVSNDSERPRSSTLCLRTSLEESTSSSRSVMDRGFGPGTDPRGVVFEDDGIRTISYRKHGQQIGGLFPTFHSLPSTPTAVFPPSRPSLATRVADDSASPTRNVGQYRHVSFFDEDWPVDDRSSLSSLLVLRGGVGSHSGLILPRTPLTPSLVITPATEGEASPGTPRTTSPTVGTVTTVTEDRVRAGELRRGGKSPDRLSTEEGAVPFRSKGSDVGPPSAYAAPAPVRQLRGKRSFAEKLSLLKPLLMVDPGQQRRAPVMESQSTGVTVLSADSAYSPSPGHKLQDTRSTLSPSATSGSGSPLLSPITGGDSPATISTPSSWASTPQTSPVSGPRRSSGGGQETYVIQVTNSKGSPNGGSSPIGNDADRSSSRGFPDLTIVGSGGEVYMARADPMRDRLELVRLAETSRTLVEDRVRGDTAVELRDDDRHQRGDLLLATLSTTGGLRASVKNNLVASLARDVIIARAPCLKSTSDQGRGADENAVEMVVIPESKADGVRQAGPKKTKAIMGPKPGCYGNHTLVTPESTFEWAQASSLTKCIDLTSKVTVAKLHSRMFKGDKLVIGPSAEALGPILMLSACKIWWEQHAKKDFRTTS